jgi:hypothetical protein
VHLLNWAGSLFLVAQYAMYSSQRVVGNFLVQQLPIAAHKISPQSSYLRLLLILEFSFVRPWIRAHLECRRIPAAQSDKARGRRRRMRARM